MRLRRVAKQRRLRTMQCIGYTVCITHCLPHIAYYTLFTTPCIHISRCKLAKKQLRALTSVSSIFVTLWCYFRAAKIAGLFGCCSKTNQDTWISDLKEVHQDPDGKFSSLSLPKKIHRSFVNFGRFPKLLVFSNFEPEISTLLKPLSFWNLYLSIKPPV